MEIHDELLNEPHSFREAAVDRIVHYIRTAEIKRAGLLLKYFQKRGERVSHEIAAAYEHLKHGCPTFSH